MRIKNFVLCTSALTMVGAMPAYAQVATSDDPAEAQDTGDIVVTGFRESLASSRNLKRNADQIVDAVVAEDIGKLPDLAVSDTAARIPGIQVVRLGGEASQVLLRGLDEQFFNTLYNGREIFTAERRQVALQDFPSAGIAALEVYKTGTANLVEAGVIGLTNVRSRRPFDIEGFEVAGNVWGLHTVQAGKVTPNGNILVSNRWETGIGEIGILVNASFTELEYLDSEPSNTDFIADPTINGQQVRLPDIQRLFYRSGNRKRPSVNASLQWRPSDTLELYAEGLYQGFRNQVDDRLAAVPLFGGQSYSNIMLRPGTNLVSSGTVVNPGAPIFSFQGGTFNKTDTYQFAVGGIYNSGPLKITADVARTKSTFVGSTESVDRVFGVNGYTVNFDLETPQFAVSGFDIDDASNYRFDGLYEEKQRAEGDDWQARIDAEYKLDGSVLSSIQLGARYTTRDAHREFGNRFAGFGGQGIPITSLPLTFELNRVGFRNTGLQSGFQSWLSPTYDSIRANRRALREFVIARGAGNFTVEDVAPNPDSIYDATEETLAGYGQANFNFDDVINGTIGLRVVKTDISLNGNALVAGVVTPIAADRTFTDYLPNASVRWRITPNVQLRASFTETRTKPTFQQLNPSANVGTPDPLDNNVRRGFGGNPLLQPIDSKSYDASLEWYFSRTGFVAATIFRRDLKGFIQDQPGERFTDPTLGLVEITRPVNSRSGRIDGVEAQLSTFFDFDFLPEFFRNFGVQANYTYLDAATDFVNQAGDFQRGAIQGVSKHTYNLTGLFERGPISARLTYNKRSMFLDFRQPRGDEANGFFQQFGHPPGRLDFSANVRFTPNTTLFFDATNLTGEAFRYSFISARNGTPAANYVRFLRVEEQTFSVGLRFKL